jgi:hypothetical protein
LALKDFIERHQKDSVTEGLNEVYSKENSRSDDFIVTASSTLLGREAW